METNAAILIGYLVLMVGVIWWVSRGNGLSDFLIAGRRNSGIVMGSGIVIGWVDILWFTFYTSMSYIYGWWILPLVLLPIFLGFGWLSWQAPSIKKHSTDTHMITMADWFTHHFDRLSGRVVSYGIVLAMGGWLAAIMMSMGLIADETYGIDYTLTVLMLAVFTLGMALKGGFGSLTRFDMIQMIIFLCLGAATIILWPTHDLDVSLIKMASMPTPGFMESAGIFITFFSSVIAASDVWQRMHAVRSVADLKRGMVWAAFWLLPALGLSFWFGMTALANQTVSDPNLAFSSQLEFIKGTMLESVVLLMLLVAVLSTLNVTVYGAASCVAKNLMPAAPEENLRQRIRWLIPIIVFVALLISLISQDVMTLAISLLSSYACFAPVLVLQSLSPLWLPRKGMGYILALSFITFLVLTFTLPGPWQMLLPPAITLVFCPLVVLFRIRKKPLNIRQKKA